MRAIVDLIFAALYWAVQIYVFIWFIRILLSWLTAFRVLSVDQTHPLFRFLARITDGVVNALFGRFRHRLVFGMMDFSPLVFLLLLQILRSALLPALYRFIVALFFPESLS